MSGVSRNALSATQAQALHADAAARGTPSPIWFVSADPAHPGRVVARAYVETHAGGELVGVLIAASLDEVRALLPTGLTRREWAPVLGSGILEMWD